MDVAPAANGYFQSVCRLQVLLNLKFCWRFSKQVVNFIKFRVELHMDPSSGMHQRKFTFMECMESRRAVVPNPMPWPVAWAWPTLHRTVPRMLRSHLGDCCPSAYSSRVLHVSSLRVILYYYRSMDSSRPRWLACEAPGCCNWHGIPCVRLWLTLPLGLAVACYPLPSRLVSVVTVLVWSGLWLTISG